MPAARAAFMGVYEEIALAAYNCFAWMQHHELDPELLWLLGHVPLSNALAFAAVAADKSTPHNPSLPKRATKTFTD